MAQSNVVWPKAGSGWLPLDRIAELLENTAIFLEEEVPISHTPEAFKRAAKELRARQDHADPCGDEACPCRKAEADSWRDHGAVRY